MFYVTWQRRGRGLREKVRFCDLYCVLAFGLVCYQDPADVLSVMSKVLQGTGVNVVPDIAKIGGVFFLVKSLCFFIAIVRRCCEQVDGGHFSHTAAGCSVCKSVRGPKVI